VKIKKASLTILLTIFFIQNIYPTAVSNSLHYGEGLILNPSADMREEGTIGLQYSDFGYIRHYRVTAYPFRWLSGSFFYYDINSARYGKGINQSFKDKGFSLKALLHDRNNLSISFGLEDFAGTGHFDSEYLVGTYSKDNFNFTVGFGFGHIAQGNSSYKHPLRKFEERPIGYSNLGGSPEFSKWFRGRIGVFGGLEAKIPFLKNTTYKIEYEDHSNTANAKAIYERNQKNRINHGLNIQLNEDIGFGIFLLGQTTPAFNLSFNRNFSTQKKKSLVKKTNLLGKNIETYVLNELASNGYLLQKANINENDNSIDIEYIQTNIINEKQASIDLYKFLYNEYGFSKQSHAIKNGPVNLGVINYSENKIKSVEPKIEKSYTFNPRVIYPAYGLAITPNYKNHIGSPAGFIFSEVNLTLSTNIALNKYIEFSSNYIFPVWNNYEQLNYNPAQTKSPPVRIEIQKYLKQGTSGFDNFHFDFIKQYDNHLALVSVGEFETMYGGLRFEYLYKPLKYQFALGFNINKVKKRDYDKILFSYLDYETTTGHINLYYMHPSSKVLANLSYGKYLAKDIGYTFDLSKRFTNGLILGAYFSITDMPLELFGEGSFDKGVYASIPLNSIFSLGNPRKARFNEHYKPITRDGAAKVMHSKNLYDIAYYRSKLLLD